MHCFLDRLWREDEERQQESIRAESREQKDSLHRALCRVLPPCHPPLGGCCGYKSQIDNAHPHVRKRKHPRTSRSRSVGSPLLSG